MGIGRRAFLKFLGAAAGATALSPGDAVQILDCHYVNRKLGLAFRAPSGWSFANVKAMGRVMEGQINATEDEIAKQVLADEPLPVVTLTREVLGSKDQFTPGITIYLDRLTEDWDERSWAQTDIQLTQRLCENFELLSGVREFELSQCEAFDNSAKALFKHERIEPTMVRMRNVLVNHHPCFYTIRMFDSPYANDEFRYDEFLSGLKLL